MRNQITPRPMKSVSAGKVVCIHVSGLFLNDLKSMFYIHQSAYNTLSCDRRDSYMHSTMIDT